MPFLSRSKWSISWIKYLKIVKPRTFTDTSRTSILKAIRHARPFNRKRSILSGDYFESLLKTGSQPTRPSGIRTSQSSTTPRQSSSWSLPLCRRWATTSSWASTSIGRSFTRSSGRIRSERDGRTRFEAAFTVAF